MREVVRTARFGRSALLTVTFRSMSPVVPIAYGADRAVLAWIETRALRTGRVERPLAEFFRDFDLAPSGREYQRFKSSVERLEHLAIHVQVAGEQEENFLFPRAAPHGMASGEVHGVVRRTDSRLELDPDFWNHLKSSAVPTPLALLRRFHARPKAWDLAALLLYRSFSARHPSVLPWSELRRQIGSVDQSPRRLKATLETVLAEIRAIYPSFSARFLDGQRGLWVAPWRLRAAETLTGSQRHT